MLFSRVVALFVVQAGLVGASSRRGPTPCPIPECGASPCAECEGRLCSLKPTYVEIDGRKCPGCPDLLSCGMETEAGVICPRPVCATNPCDACGDDAKCTISAPKMMTVVGIDCPGCPTITCTKKSPRTSRLETVTPHCPAPVLCEADPCEPCGGGECNTLNPIVHFGRMGCPTGCPVFESCKAVSDIDASTEEEVEDAPPTPDIIVPVPVPVPDEPALPCCKGPKPNPGSVCCSDDSDANWIETGHAKIRGLGRARVCHGLKLQPSQLCP